MVSEPRADAIKKLVGEFTEKTGINVEFNILAYPTLQEKQDGGPDPGHRRPMTSFTWTVSGVGQYAGEGWDHSGGGVYPAHQPRNPGPG